MESNLTDKLPLKEHLQNVKKILRFIREMDRNCFRIMCLVQAVQVSIPYIELLLSAYILDAVSAQKGFREMMMVILLSMTGILVLRFLASAMSHHLEVRRAHMSNLYSCIVQTRMLNMDFSRIDSPEVKKLKDRIRTDNNWGAGINSVFWTGNAILYDVFEIAGAAILGAPVAVYLIRSGSLTAWLVLAFLLAVSVFSLQMQTHFRRQADAYRYSDYKDAADKEERFCFSWEFAFADSFNYKNSKDIRLYESNRLMERWTNEVLSHKGFRSLLLKGAWGDAGDSFFSGISRNAILGASYLTAALIALAEGITVGSVVRFAGCISRLLTSAKGLADNLSYFALAARRQLSTLELIGLEDEMYKGKLPVEKRSDNAYQIEFRNVSFRYPGTEQYALKNFSMKLKIGEKLAIVGMNGSGKTTMIKLLCRLYDPQQGEILLNGVDIRKFRQDEYSKLFSVVFQDYTLFPFRLAENVAVDQRCDRELVQRSLENAGFGDRLSCLEQGIDTFLYKDYDDSGLEISGGEAQKIAIARAVYKDAPFILLDEPTATLDPLAEYDIYTNFDGIVGEKTAIYISHRLSSCRFCEKIAVFHEGSLVQLGTHEELLADTEGKYCEMWNAQAQYYKDTGIVIEGI